MKRIDAAVAELARAAGYINLTIEDMVHGRAGAATQAYAALNILESFVGAEGYSRGEGEGTWELCVKTHIAPM